MYAEFDFYTNQYYGDTITEDEWPKYGSRASDYLDWMTRRQMVDNLPTEEGALAKISKACCAVADQLKRIDEIRASESAADNGIAVNGQVRSVSSGGESISFEASAASKAVAGGEADVNRYLYEVAKPYLSGVADDRGHLYLYWGI